MTVEKLLLILIISVPITVTILGGIIHPEYLNFHYENLPGWFGLSYGLTLSYILLLVFFSVIFGASWINSKVSPFINKVLRYKLW